MNLSTNHQDNSTGSDPSDGSGTTGRIFRRTVAGTVALGIAVAGFGIGIPTAGAETAKPIDIARTRCLEGADKRLTALSTMSSKISADQHLTDAHQSTLDGIVAAATNGITDLRPQIESAADAAALRTACTSMVNDYRVFALVARQVHITRATDAIQAASAKITQAQDRLDGVIAKAEAAGKDVSAAKSDDAAFDAAVTSFTDGLGKVPSVTGITPADYNADKTVLDNATTSLKELRTQAKSVRAAGAKVRDDLKALRSR